MTKTFVGKSPFAGNLLFSSLTELRALDTDGKKTVVQLMGRQPLYDASADWNKQMLGYAYDAYLSVCYLSPIIIAVVVVIIAEVAVFFLYRCCFSTCRAMPVPRSTLRLLWPSDTCCALWTQPATSSWRPRPFWMPRQSWGHVPNCPSRTSWLCSKWWSPRPTSMLN